MTYIVQEYWHKDVMPDDIKDINSLLIQLSREGVAQSINHYELKVSLKENILWVARQQNPITRKNSIVAMGLIIPNIIFGRSDSFGYIQKMVTDKDHRGKKEHVTVKYLHTQSGKTQSMQSRKNQSLAEVIVGEMILFAKSYKYGHLELTSGPDRVAANRLYQRLGFVLTSRAEISGTNRYLIDLHK